MIKILSFSLISLLVILIACNKKDDSGIQAGTYYGTVHEYGSYATGIPGGTETGSQDTTYADVLAVEIIGTDSVRFRFQGKQATYKLLEENAHYCLACDPTRDLNDYQVVGDSVYYHYHIYGGSCQYYFTSSLDFAGLLQ